MKTNCPHHATNSRRPLTFKLPAFQEDERLRFVDSVCRALMTSRFGDGAMYSLNRRFRGTADEPFDYLSLLEEEPCGWHERENHLVGFRTGRVLPGQNRVATRAGEILLADSNGASFRSLGRAGPALKPPAHAGGSPLARGSPTFLGRSSSRLLCVLCVIKTTPRKGRKKNAKEDAKKSWDVRPTHLPKQI